MNLKQAEWRKASRSKEDGSNCIELAGASGIIAIRDSKETGGPMLVVSRRDFGSFAQVLKNL